MAISELAQLGIMTGASLLGHKLLGGTPKVPDLSGMVGKEFDAQRARLTNQMDRQRSNLLNDLAYRTKATEGALAAAGLTGSGTIGAMDNLYRQNNLALNNLGGQFSDLMLQLSAEEAAAKNAAAQQSAMMNYQAELQKKQAQYQGLSDLLGAATSMYNMSQLVGSEPGLLGDIYGGGGGGAFGLPRLPMPGRENTGPFQMPLAQFKTM